MCRDSIGDGGRTVIGLTQFRHYAIISTFAAMDPKSFILSGLIEKYCQGSCTPEEIELVAAMASKYPGIKQEIEIVCGSIEQYHAARAVEPSKSVKHKLMLQLYRQEASVNIQYPPLISSEEDTLRLRSWTNTCYIEPMPASLENLFIMPLPGTPIVTNFLVYAKHGHETEIHEDYIEYLYVIKGSCRMYFEEKEESFKEGDLITIPPHINHHAVVTSAFPMLALVQRQLIA